VFPGLPGSQGPKIKKKGPNSFYPKGLGTFAPAHLHKAVMNLPKRGMTLARVEEKTVCKSNKACKQVGLDIGDLMGK